jgi:hypothetical protein
MTATDKTKLDGLVNLSVDSNEGITITSNSIGTVYNSTIADTVQSVAVGGATAQAASV